jgi:hypothetical protein
VINYSGAVITWICKDLGWWHLPGDKRCCTSGQPGGPDLSGAGFLRDRGSPLEQRVQCRVLRDVPHDWQSQLVKAALESIAYQVSDVVAAMALVRKLPFRL